MSRYKNLPLMLMFWPPAMSFQGLPNEMLEGIIHLLPQPGHIRARAVARRWYYAVCSSPSFYFVVTVREAETTNNVASLLRARFSRAVDLDFRRKVVLGSHIHMTHELITVLEEYAQYIDGLYLAPCSSIRPCQPCEASLCERGLFSRQLPNLQGIGVNMQLSSIQLLTSLWSGWLSGGAPSLQRVCVDDRSLFDHDSLPPVLQANLLVVDLVIQAPQVRTLNRVASFFPNVRRLRIADSRYFDLMSSTDWPSIFCLQHLVELDISFGYRDLSEITNTLYHHFIPSITLRFPRLMDDCAVSCTLHAKKILQPLQLVIESFAPATTTVAVRTACRNYMRRFDVSNSALDSMRPQLQPFAAHVEVADVQASHVDALLSLFPDLPALRSLSIRLRDGVDFRYDTQLTVQYPALRYVEVSLGMCPLAGHDMWQENASGAPPEHRCTVQETHTVDASFVEDVKRFILALGTHIIVLSVDSRATVYPAVASS